VAAVYHFYHKTAYKTIKIGVFIAYLFMNRQPLFPPPDYNVCKEINLFIINMA